MPLYHRMGIRGVDNESINGWATVAPSNYYEAKMLWDVTLKARPVLHRFCVSAFGKAAVLPWLPGLPPQAFPTTISSFTSPQSVSPQSTAALALGLLHTP